MLSSNQYQHDHSNNDFISLLIACQRLSSMARSYEHLTELNLSNLQLIRIDSFPFDYFPRLSSLDLSHNQLQSIDPIWTKSIINPTIEHLNLSHNQLDTLVYLKDFSRLNTLNISGNVLRRNERFLALYLCPTLEHMIDVDIEHIEMDRALLNRLLHIIQRHMNAMDSSCRQTLIDRIEIESDFVEFHLSPIGNYLLDKTFDKYRPTINLETQLTLDFARSMNLHDINVQPKRLLRSHHHQHADVTLKTTAVHMCAFEPNTTNNILATCGGEKVCLIDCDSGEITHLFQVTQLHASMKGKSKILPKHFEHFTCLCWIEIAQTRESLKILAVGTSHGHIYLLSYKWKLMFAHIELPVGHLLEILICM
jgi:Leucine-rich repeat (LRR) protein